MTERNSIHCGDCRQTVDIRAPAARRARVSDADLYCPRCNLSTVASLECPRCGSVICRSCGSITESSSDLGYG